MDTKYHLKKEVVLAIIIFFIGSNIFPISSGANKISDNNEHKLLTDQYIMTKQFSIFSHPAKQYEIDQMKNLSGVYENNKNYNIIYDGHGTGLAPPTEKDYQRMVGSLFIVDLIRSPAPLLDSYDLSTDPCFPIVGNQGQQGSCAAWAATYYANGYLQAKNNNWTLAHSGNPFQLLSPAWTFNKCNHNNGSWSDRYDNEGIMNDTGVCRWSQMPYNDSDYSNWGNESAWRDAPSYRIQNISALLPPYDNTTINEIKILINNGIPVTFGINAGSYNYFKSDDVLGSDVLLNNPNHANTIIGYSNTKKDNETGETGAFKIVNSWGRHWGPTHNGYYWITYQAFLGAWNVALVRFFDDRYVNTSPSLVTVWHLNPTPDQDANISLSIGLNNTRLNSKEPCWNEFAQSLHPYPSFMCLDITEFYNEWAANASDFYLEIGDSTGNNGTITSFKIEYYSGTYTPGYPSNISIESPDIPKNTPGSVMVTFPYDQPATNHPPNKPKKPTGPTTRVTGQQGTYWANGTDPDGDKIQYRFDWNASGSHSYSSWTSLVNSGTKLGKNHTWTSPGTYVVKVQSRDEHGVKSVWSNGLTVIVNT
jgi:C1A family cysteine protease